MTTNCQYEGSKEITNPSVHARATGRHGSTAGHLGGGVGQADLDEGEGHGPQAGGQGI